MRIMSLSAKCSDLFNAQLTKKENGIETIFGEYDGYVPDFMPGEHYGDYVRLEIDLDTGKILNWKKPTTADLKIFKPVET
jgi:hypothetical protein